MSEEGELNSCKPTETVYLLMSIGNYNGTINCQDLPEGFFKTETAAINAAKDEFREYGLQGVIYECRPMSAVYTHHKVKKVRK